MSVVQGMCTHRKRNGIWDIRVATCDVQRRAAQKDAWSCGKSARGCLCACCMPACMRRMYVYYVDVRLRTIPYILIKIFQSCCSLLVRSSKMTGFVGAKLQGGCAQF